MATKLTATRLAKKLFGKETFVEFREKASTEEEKQKVRDKLKTLNATREAKSKELLALTKENLYGQLLDNVKLFLSDELLPGARELLQKTVGRIDLLESLRKESRELNELYRQKVGLLHGHRCACYVNTGFYAIQQATGDTWEELEANMRIEAEKKK